VGSAQGDLDDSRARFLEGIGHLWVKDLHAHFEDHYWENAKLLSLVPAFKPFFCGPVSVCVCVLCQATGHGSSALQVALNTLEALQLVEGSKRDAGTSAVAGALSALMALLTSHETFQDSMDVEEVGPTDLCLAPLTDYRVRVDDLLSKAAAMSKHKAVTELITPTKRKAVTKHKAAAMSKHMSLLPDTVTELITPAKDTAAKCRGKFLDFLTKEAAKCPQNAPEMLAELNGLLASAMAFQGPAANEVVQNVQKLLDQAFALCFRLSQGLHSQCCSCHCCG
jgi:hypothetical protein